MRSGTKRKKKKGENHRHFKDGRYHGESFTLIPGERPWGKVAGVSVSPRA